MANPQFEGGMQAHRSAIDGSLGVFCEWDFFRIIEIPILLRGNKMKVGSRKPQCEKQRLMGLVLQVLIHRDNCQQGGVTIDKGMIRHVRSFEGRTT
jgi:hypothetical protein